VLASRKPNVNIVKKVEVPMIKKKVISKRGSKKKAIGKRNRR